MEQPADVLPSASATIEVTDEGTTPKKHRPAVRDAKAATNQTQPEASLSERVISLLFRKRGDLRWDVMIRTAGVLALLAIPLILFVPSSIPLVAFALFSLPINGPLSPVLPTAWEPLIIQTSTFSPAWLVTLVGLSVYMYMEYINWHIYGWLFRRERLKGVRQHRWTQWAVRTFSRSPFAAVIIFAISPLPFWTVRILAVLDRYSVTKFMIATAIGRAPRVFFYAWVGTVLNVPGVLLIAVGVGIPLIVIALRLMRGQQLLPKDEALAETTDQALT